MQTAKDLVYEPEGELLGVNAVAESFFSSLKKERIKKQIYKNRAGKADVADYINTFCNPTRPHTHLGELSPEQFEAAHKPRRHGLH